MTYRIALAGIAAAITLASTPANAAYLIDTGLTTTAPDYNVNINYSLYAGQDLAGYVTFDSDVTISSIEGYLSDSAGAFTITIYGDGALPSGAALFSASGSKPDQASGYAGVFNEDWTLTAGSYWIAFKSTDPLGMWDIAATPLGGYAFSSVFNGDYGWYTQTNLNIALRISGTPAVPEPASWAMMIGGFALAGAAMRRRQVALRFA